MGKLYATWCKCNEITLEIHRKSYGVDDRVGNGVYDRYIIDISDISTSAIRRNGNINRTITRRKGVNDRVSISVYDRYIIII